MEGIILALLILLTLISISITLLLLRRISATRDSLRALTEMAKRAAGIPAGSSARLASEGKVEELAEALKLWEAKLKEVASDLDEEREKLTAVLSTIGAGVLLLNKDGEVTMLNQTAERLFGSSSKSALGRPFISLARDHEMDNIVQRCLETKERQEGTVQVAGSRRYFEIVATPLSQGALVLVQDLTNIRRLEKMRRDFIANISHELRTPIASLKALVETLQDGAIADKEVAQDFLHRMHLETDKLAQMASELSELSRIESGDSPLNLKPLDVAEVVRRAAERLRPQAERAQLELILDMPANLPPVIGDEDRVEQVLVNVIHNAIKFTPRQGRITISSLVEGDQVLISISDTGIGIPAEDLPHIFERFYKVDRARSGGGTGLGLAIAKHIVQAHRGRIWAESEEGKGTTITFSLPTAKP